MRAGCFSELDIKIIVKFESKVVCLTGNKIWGYHAFTSKVPGCGSVEGLPLRRPSCLPGSPGAQWPPPPGADIDMAAGPHEGSEDDVIVPSDPDDGAEHYSPSSSGSGF